MRHLAEAASLKENGRIEREVISRDTRLGGILMQKGWSAYELSHCVKRDFESPIGGRHAEQRMTG
jgi:hypothetical protein